MAALGALVYSAISVDFAQLPKRRKPSRISVFQVPGAGCTVRQSKPRDTRLDRLRAPRSASCSGG